MTLRAGAATHVGRVRERNEDSYLVREPLFAVADGMGGHRGGDVASALVLEILGASVEDEPSAAGVLEQIQEANQRVLERGGRELDLQGMGTTLTAVLVSGDQAHVAHVGDSRAYLVRDGEIHQLTEDHTLVQRMVHEGRLSPGDAGRHPHRSILTRAVGVEEDIPVDQLTLDLRAGDRVLLCTDGLTGMLSDERILEVISGEPDPQAASDRLVVEANQAGGDDNITVVVLEVLDEAGRSAPAVEARGTVAIAPVPAERSEVKASPKRRRPVRWGRVGVWVGGVLAILLLSFFGLRAYLDHQWYVGDAHGQVAIYNGIPSRLAGFELSHVQELTDLASARAERLEPWKELSAGITARSFEDAQTIVDQIRQDLSPVPSIPGIPSPTPSPTGGG
jgi:serine/threonine protein phosphatase PrpC